jgi:hypothetical protein
MCGRRRGILPCRCLGFVKAAAVRHHLEDAAQAKNTNYRDDEIGVLDLFVEFAAVDRVPHRSG